MCGMKRLKVYSRKKKGKDVLGIMCREEGIVMQVEAHTSV